MYMKNIVKSWISCPSWQWHRTGSRCQWSPVRTVTVVPLWCDLGFFPNSRGNKAAANLRPIMHEYQSTKVPDTVARLDKKNPFHKVLQT